MCDVVVTELRSEHCAQVAAIEKATFSLPWSEEAFRECVDKPDRYYLCAVCKGEILGYCGYWKILDEAEVYNVAVKEEARGRGIGELLLNELIRYGKYDERKKFLLEVRCSNEAAIKLYKKLGFKEDGIRPGFYDAPKEDALLMSLEIQPGN